MTDNATLRYAQDLATAAAKLVGCSADWKPLDDVLGCLTQIDNCLTGLVARRKRDDLDGYVDYQGLPLKTDAGGE